MSLTRTLSMTARDIKRWRYTREHWRAVNRIEVRGFVAGRDTALNAPLFSEWVGLAPGEGNQTGTVERKIIHDYGTVALNQAGLNQRAGRLGAAQDGIYVDADGALTMALDLELTLRGVYDLFDFYDEVVEIDVATNKRGIDFSEHLFVFMGSSLSFENGVAETTVRFRTCTNGTAGHTYVPPTSPLPPGDGQPPPPSQPPSNPPPPLSWGTGRIGFISDDGYLYYTFSFNAPEPLWFRVNTGMSGTLHDFVPYAFSPRYLTGAGNVVLYAVTADEVYGLAWNPDSPTVMAASASQYTFPTGGAFGSVIETERGFPGVVGVVRVFSNVANDYHGTTDGATWSIYANINVGGGGAFPVLYVSPKTPGRIDTAESLTTGAIVGQRSSNNGASFSPQSVPDVSGDHAIGTLHVPFNNNANENVRIYGTFDSSPQRYIFATDAAGVAHDITPEADHWVTGPKGADTCPLNRNYLVVCATNPTDLHVWSSSNGGGSLTLIDDSNIYSGVSYAGNDIEHFYLYGLSGAIAGAGIDGMVVSRMGNLASFSPGAVLRIFGW